MPYLMALLIALQAADWITTREILKHGGREKNPLIRWLMGKVGVDRALGLKTLVVIGIGAVLTQIPWPFIAALSALYGYVITSNILVLRRLKAKGN